MKLLILSQYFPPEVGAPQNRLYEIAERLNQDSEIEVDVLTAMPNYPSMKIHDAYKGKWWHHEKIGSLNVFRAWIFVSESKSILFRLFNYFSFVFTSLWFGWAKLKMYDVILVESPPLFLGISAYLLCKLKGAKMIFNVSDLWPESAEKLGLVTNKTVLSLTTKLEEFMYQKSELITGQTQGIVKNIKGRFPNKDVYWLPNGVDTSKLNREEITSDFRKVNGFDESDFLLLYAGIIGHAQGLELILNAAQAIENPAVKFLLVGSGPVKEDLIQLKKQMALENVFFFDAVSKKEIPNIVKACDVALVPLKKLDLFKGAIPSKVFENLAMEIPVLLGVEGEAKSLFIDQGNAGWFFEPENTNQLVEKINYIVAHPEEVIEKGKNGRVYVSEFFERSKLANQFAEKLKTLN